MAGPMHGRPAGRPAVIPSHLWRIIARARSLVLKTVDLAQNLEVY
jgi:hypothetical protein